MLILKNRNIRKYPILVNTEKKPHLNILILNITLYRNHYYYYSSIIIHHNIIIQFTDCQLIWRSLVTFFTLP